MMAASRGECLASSALEQRSRMEVEVQLLFRVSRHLSETENDISPKFEITRSRRTVIACYAPVPRIVIYK
jgi:hypothetical protein